MANIEAKTKLILEELFDMNSGYVMNLSSTKFSDLIYDVTRIKIYDEKYNFRSGSKANRLRSLWNIESNQNVAAINLTLLDYWEQQFRLSNPDEEKFYRYYNLKVDAVKQLTLLSKDTRTNFNTSILESIKTEKDFQLLKNDIQRTLDNNEPQLALDRTHTLLVTYFRKLCTKHGIVYNEKETVDNLFSKYINHFNKLEYFESDMSIKILRLPSQALEKYNNVRNNKSFAHSNTILKYSESNLIIEFVFLVLKFVVNLEEQYDDDLKEEQLFPF
ncbi:MAG: abortive infection family protein [Oscillospiraceae bacterium]